MLGQSLTGQGQQPGPELVAATTLLNCNSSSTNTKKMAAAAKASATIEIEVRRRGFASFVLGNDVRDGVGSCYLELGLAWRRVCSIADDVSLELGL